MRATRRTQLLMDPDEYRRLRELARGKKTSVGELIRTAVRATYLEPQKPDRRPIVEAILQMNLPALSWRRARREIEAAHARLP
ncbi:MAG: ribbon-helix-helix protein, CopG family [Acidobacteriia bacterium]|nr:ribbon-helix-helix protein, CopG family [Terriglobia bacterium]